LPLLLFSTNDLREVGEVLLPGSAMLVFCGNQINDLVCFCLIKTQFEGQNRPLVIISVFDHTTMKIQEYLSIEELTQLVANGFTDEQISTILKERHPGICGLSSCSVKRFRHEQRIYPAERLSDDNLDLIIGRTIEEVPTQMTYIDYYLRMT
jgi:hypothetical protein